MVVIGLGRIADEKRSRNRTGPGEPRAPCRSNLSLGDFFVGCFLEMRLFRVDNSSLSSLRHGVSGGVIFFLEAMVGLHI